MKKVAGYKAENGKIYCLQGLYHSAFEDSKYSYHQPINKVNLLKHPQPCKFARMVKDSFIHSQSVLCVCADLHADTKLEEL